jgi:hypothetical protein
MKNDLTTGAWQHDIGCSISIALLSTSDARARKKVEPKQSIPQQYDRKGNNLNISRSLRGCPQAQFFSHKNIKTYLSCPKKGTFGGLPSVALSRG